MENLIMQVIYLEFIRYDSIDAFRIIGVDKKNPAFIKAEIWE